MTNYGKMNPGFDTVRILHADQTCNIQQSGSNTFYIGFAEPGTAISGANWQLRMTNYSGGALVNIWFGSGSNMYMHKWTDRERISYS